MRRTSPASAPASPRSSTDSSSESWATVISSAPASACTSVGREVRCHAARGNSPAARTRSSFPFSAARRHFDDFDIFIEEPYRVDLSDSAETDIRKAAERYAMLLEAHLRREPGPMGRARRLLARPCLQRAGPGGSDDVSTADLHIHTRVSDGMATVESVLEYVQERTELDVIAITDHEDVTGACARANWPPGAPTASRLSPAQR